MIDGNSENNSIKIGVSGTHLVGGSQIQTDSVEEDGQQKNKENEIRVLRQHRQFLKYAGKIGEGSFKRVYKGFDTSNGLYVAWCEILVSRICVLKIYELFQEKKNIVYIYIYIYVHVPHFGSLQCQYLEKLKISIQTGDRPS